MSLIPIRDEPSHRSEMTSQLLFGEKATVLNETDEWFEISTEFDNYTGWLEKKSVEDFREENLKKVWMTNPLPLLTIEEDNKKIRVPAGGEIPVPDESGYFIINERRFQFDPSVIEISKSIVKTALKFENAPYLWGGRSIMGIDCSGFIQLVYKINGITLPRDTKDQCKEGSLVSSVDETISGDLFFFSNKEGKINHVGMLIEPGKIIHSSGLVRIDRIDNKGILNIKSGKYSHTLNSIKRIL